MNKKKKETKISISFSEFEKDNLRFENIKSIIDLAIEDVVRNIYIIMSSHTVFRGLHSKLKKDSSGRIDQPQTFEDYDFSLRLIKQHCDKLELGFNFAAKLKIKKLNDTAIIREEYSKMLKEAIDFVFYAIEIRKDKELKNERDYFKLINNYYSRMIASLTNLAKIADYPNLTIEKYGEGYKKLFESLANYFKLNVEMIKTIISDERETRKNLEKKEKEKAIAEAKAKALKPIPNEREIFRQQLIVKANEYYDEFCLDFLRDLEQQIPFSTRDLYKEFIEVRFANFVKRFNMPLSKDASIGKANEVIYQINLMIEYIEKIKENSYVTSVYGE